MISTFSLPPYLLPSPQPQNIFVDFRFGYIKTPVPRIGHFQELQELQIYTGRLPSRFPVVRAKSPPPPPPVKETGNRKVCSLHYRNTDTQTSLLLDLKNLSNIEEYPSLWSICGACSKLNILFSAMQYQLNK